MLQRLAEQIRDGILNPVWNAKKSVFLCGKDLADKTSLRYQIGERFTNHWLRRWQYTIVYPEELFQELLAGPFHRDLLSLENLIADAVDAIVLIPESIGAATELGAFANHELLRKRLVCVLRKEDRRKKSFINYGPVRLLRDKKVGAIVYIDPDDLDEGASAIAKAVESVATSDPRSSGFRLNAINADNYLLACLFLLDTPDPSTLCELVKFAAGVGEEQAYGIVHAGLAVLRRRGLITHLPSGFRYCDDVVAESHQGVALTDKGFEAFRTLNKTGKYRHRVRPDYMDALRCELLTFTCRNRRLLLR